MSADNWTQCPRCYVTNREKLAVLEKTASESYGNAPAEQFDRLREDARSFCKAISSNGDFTETLREDYEIGIQEGEFYVSYGSFCQTCGFTFSYTHEEKVK